VLYKEDSEIHAREAVELFCYQASKHLGALAAALGGVETLVFTAGIGENSPAIRQRICQNLAFLGIHVDPQRNSANATIISPEKNTVSVRVMKTDEDLMVARHTNRLIKGE
jgi:acetate kinase